MKLPRLKRYWRISLWMSDGHQDVTLCREFKWTRGGDGNELTRIEYIGRVGPTADYRRLDAIVRITSRKAFRFYIVLE